MKSKNPFNKNRTEQMGEAPWKYYVNEPFENLFAIFASKKAFYNAVYVAAKLAEIKAAEEMPDEQARNETHETLRIQLKKKALACREYWKYLERYIVSAFLKDEHKTNLDAAGKVQYDEAGDDNWDIIALMMSNAYEFITNNSVILGINLETGTPDNMPAGFILEFEGVKTDFDNGYKAFLQAEEGAQTGTQTKNDANDMIYEKMMQMLGDGQAYIKNNPAVKKQFVLTNLLELVGTPTGGTGITKTGDLNSGEQKNLFVTDDLKISSKFKGACNAGPGFWLYSANSEGEGFSGAGKYVTAENADAFTWADIGGQKAFVNCYNPNGISVTYEVSLI